MKENRPLEYCLQSDEEFILHETKSTEKQTCSKSYDRNKINSYLGYPTALEIKEKESATSDSQTAYTTISRTKDEKEQTFSNNQSQPNMDDFEER